MFHLLSHTDGEGGQSLLVDGWKAASILQLESPDDYHILQSQPMRWHCSGNTDVHIDTMGPVLPQHIPHHGTTMGPTIAPGPIRWNNSDRANAVQLDHSAYVRWLQAARRWNDIIKRPQLEYWDQLRPGTPLSKFSCVSWGHISTQTDARCLQSLTTSASCTAGPLLRVSVGCVGLIVSCHREKAWATWHANVAITVNMDDFVSRWRTLNFKRDLLLDYSA